MINFLLFFTLFIIIVVPLISLLFFRDGGKSIGSPFIMGVLVYIIGIQVLKTLLFKFIGYLPGDPSIFWGNKWFYGIFMSVTTGICVELIRFFILNIRNKNKRWSSSVRRNAVMGIGEGWITATFTWGYFIATVTINLLTGEDISSYGLTEYYMIIMIIEKAIALFMYVALTFIAQYAVKKNKIKNYLILCIAIHSIAEMGIYFIPYQFNLPLWAGEIFYACIAASTFAYGYILIKSLHSHKVRISES